MITPWPKTSRLVATLLLTLLILLAFVISGFTVAKFEAQPNLELPVQPGLNTPEAGQLDRLRPGSGKLESVAPHGAPASQLANVIKNGDFEKNPTSSVATYWEPFNNGQAIFGWYAERWEEAVHSGKQSQLMEINFVEGNLPNRIIAIYQTVDVVPNANYNLTIHALMRSDAPIELRNKGDYAMQWGIDYRGSGKHNNVTEWFTMPLSEQLRIGSNGLATHDNNRLFFQRIFTTVHTANTNRLTLFIRGVKIEPTGTEVNFNVDDVSLIGPYFPPPPPEAQTVAPAATAPATNQSFEIIPAGNSTGQEAETADEPAGNESNLPNAGAILPKNISAGVLALGGLVVIALGVAAAHSLLQPAKTAPKIGQE